MDIFSHSQFKLMTWNATGIMSSASYLIDSINSKKIDICGISEHWLYEKDLYFLKSIDTKYKCHAVSDFSLKLPSNRKVGKGGVALLWHNKWDNKVTPIDIDDDRIIGIELLIDSSNYCFIFQVYLPCKNYAGSKYRDYIEKLENIVSIYSTRGTVVIMGDMNSEIFDNNNNSSSRMYYLTNCLSQFNMCSVSTLDICSGASSTHVNYNGQVGSLIDHILVPIEKVDLVFECFIPEDDALNVSNHRPVVCSLNIPILNTDVNEDSSFNINWRNIS